jgi:hypothetical protein
MKSFYAGGASGVRTLATTVVAREGAQGNPRAECWRNQRTGGDSGFVTRRDWGLRLQISAFSRPSVSAANFLAYNLQRTGGASTMGAAVKQGVAITSDEASQTRDEDLDKFVDVAHKMADAAGDIIRQYWRTKFIIDDKDDASEFISKSPASLQIGLMKMLSQIAI